MRLMNEIEIELPDIVLDRADAAYVTDQTTGSPTAWGGMTVQYPVRRKNRIRMGKRSGPIPARKHCCCSVNCIRVTHSPEISCTSLQTNPSRSLQMNGMSSKCIAGIRNYKVL